LDAAAPELGFGFRAAVRRKLQVQLVHHLTASRRWGGRRRVNESKQHNNKINAFK
jgi:hypothetical protein